MKLTGELKEKVFNADTMEERRELIAQAGMELTENELQIVAGGYDPRDEVHRIIKEKEEEIERRRREEREKKYGPDLVKDGMKILEDEVRKISEESGRETYIHRPWLD